MVHYNYYRDYDPASGRYDQSDPVGLLASLNTFAYVSSNPLAYIDRFGLDRYAPCKGCSNAISRWLCKKGVDKSCEKDPPLCCKVDFDDCVEGIAPGEETTPEQIKRRSKCNAEYANCMFKAGRKGSQQ